MPISKFRPTFTFTQDRLEQLKVIAPEAFADGKINWESLKQALGEFLEDKNQEAEHFGLFWPGRREARRLATMPSKGTLVPTPGEGINEDLTGNIFIEGENLEVLKLLQKSYAGRIKMIYIDPPYNTGNDFVYDDDYKEPLEDYLKKTGQADENGELLTTNTKANGRFHSNWLNMIYPRLRIAYQLLREDGVIFVSIDDNELHNLLAAMNEIFGEENQIGIFVWIKKKKGSHLSKTLRSMTEYIVSYARQKDAVELFGEGAYSDKWQYLLNRPNPIGLRSFQANTVESTLPDGIYKPATYGEGDLAVKLLDPVKIIAGRIINDFRLEGRFKWSQRKIDEELSLGTRIAIKSMGFGPNLLRHDQDEKIKRPTTLLNSEVEIGTNEDANEELKDIFENEGIFAYPKPTSLISYLINSVTYWDQGGIIIDFFAGACTTAQAVLEMNREDNGNRRFIMVQLPEPTPEDSSARKAGYDTIAEIGKERIRRVIAKMKKKVNGNSQAKREMSEDLGFKVYKLTRSNFSAWEDYEGENPEELEKLFDQAEIPLVENWKEEDLLTEIILQQGFPLDSRITQQAEFNHNKVMLIESNFCAHKLFICLDNKIKDDTVKRLQISILQNIDEQKNDKEIFVCLDSALTDQAKMRLADVCNLKVI